MGQPLAPKDGSQFIGLQGGPAPMEHSMAVRTDRNQVLDSPEFGTGLVERFDMVRLNKPLTQIAKGVLEIEAAD